MKISYLITITFSSASLFSYPLSLTSGHTNHPKVTDLSGITGIAKGDILEPTSRKLFAINNAILVVTNQEKPTQLITIKLIKLIPPATTAQVKILLDSVSFVGIEGTYQIEETEQNQWDTSNSTSTTPIPSEPAGKGTLRATAIQKK